MGHISRNLIPTSTHRTPPSIRDAIWLAALQLEHLRATRHADDAVQGAQISQQRAVVLVGVQDQLRETLEGVWWFSREE